MTTVTCTTEIDAPAAAVWEVLADTPAYPGWNPFITRLDGALAVGSRLAVTIAPPGSRPMTFKPTVTALEPGRHLAWLGRVLLPGVFDGAHSFTVEPLARTTTRLTQSETFSGVLVPFFRSTLRSTEAGFAAMNAALATRAEQRS